MGLRWIELLIMLSIDDIKKEYPPRYPLNRYTLQLAHEIMDELWRERNAERLLQTEDRSGSCKFASLLARSLFGGALAGNQHHVFVKRRGRLLDLNEGQQDVLRLGEKAYIEDGSLSGRDYRDSLGSCRPRVNRWLDEYERRYEALMREHQGDSREQMALFS